MRPSAQVPALKIDHVKCVNATPALTVLVRAHLEVTPPALGRFELKIEIAGEIAGEF